MLDTPDNYSFIGVEGTDRLPGDWMVQGNDNTILGFSFQSSTIDVGDGAIVVVTMASEMGSIDFETELCFDFFEVTNPASVAYMALADCATFINPFEKSVDIELDAFQVNLYSSCKLSDFV